MRYKYAYLVLTKKYKKYTKKPIYKGNDYICLYKSLHQVSLDYFKQYIFKVRIIGDYEKNRFCYYAKQFKVIKEIKPEEVKDSQWCFHYCKSIKDTKKVRDNITNSCWAMNYCSEIKDREAMWRRIKDSTAAFFYCQWVKNRRIVRKYIED